MAPTLTCLILLFVIWLNYEIKKHSEVDYVDRLKTRERKANTTPAKDISDLPYLEVPLNEFDLDLTQSHDRSFVPHVVRASDLDENSEYNPKNRPPFLERLTPLSEEELELEDFREKCSLLADAASKKPLRLSHMTNTEIKLTYGAPNFNFLSQCDAAYTTLVKTIVYIAEYHYRHGNITAATRLLEYGISIKTDILSNYTLLSTIYKEQNNENALNSLLETISSGDFPDSRKETIKESIEKCLKADSGSSTQFLLRPDGKKTIRELLSDAGFEVDSPCGGKGKCGKCLVKTDVYGTVKACAIIPKEPVTVFFDTAQNISERFEEKNILGVKDSGADSTSNGSSSSYMLACDLGTTTIVLALQDAQGNVLRTSGFLNPGRKYGFDVMSRISACLEGHAEDMTNSLREMIESKAAELIKSVEHISRISIAGNPAMTHILMGWNVKGLSASPFKAYSLEGQKISYKGIPVYIFPALSPFVGGDIVSGLYYSGMIKRVEKNISILADLGTNGEIVLKKDSDLYVASAAAGPAFEGLDICGSDVVALIADMLGKQIIDHTGLLADDYFDEGFMTSVDGTKITIHQEDIRSLQLAKGALYTACKILLKEAEISASDISNYFIAGGIGSSMDPKAAAKIKLIDEAFLSITKPLGNASLNGLLEFNKNSLEISDFAETLEKYEVHEIILNDHPDFVTDFFGSLDF